MEPEQLIELMKKYWYVVLIYVLIIGVIIGFFIKDNFFDLACKICYAW